MRSLATYILAFVFTLPMLLNLGVMVDYGVRYQYYAEVLCDNKDKPELQCNGQCHLALATEPTSDDAPQKPEIRLPELQIIAPLEVVESKTANHISIVHFTPYVEPCTDNLISTSSEPPEVSEWS